MLLSQMEPPPRGVQKATPGLGTNEKGSTSPEIKLTPQRSFAVRRGSGPVCVMWPLRAAALPTCPSPSSCLGSAGANGTPSPKHSQLPPLRSQSPWASRTSRLGSVSVPPLSTVARVPDGQAWTQHHQPRRAGVKPEQLVSERGTGKKGGQAGAGWQRGRPRASPGSTLFF